MDPSKAILHELYVYCEWNPEPEYIQKPDGLLPEKISSVKRWFQYFGPKKTLFDSIAAHKERQQKWQIALGDEGKVIAVLTDVILEFRTKRSDYSTIAARTTVTRDSYPQWRKMEWSPDCAFLALAYGIGHVEFYDLSATKLFTIEYECSRPGGLECTDTAHAIADIIFLPTTAKSAEIKWNWEVLLVGYDGSVRAYMISLTEGFAFHHKFRFKGGVSTVLHCHLHNALYVAKLPYPSGAEPDAAYSYGLTAWRLLYEDPFAKLSVVSDNIVTQANDKFKFYIPFRSTKKMAVITEMRLSPDVSKLVCLHSNGDITIWRLPLLKLLHKFPLSSQPGHDLRNPLMDEKQLKKDPAVFHAADVNWWSNEEIIVSRFSGAVSVCGIGDLVNLLSSRAEFLQGAPRLTRAFDAGFLALECEAAVLPARPTASDQTMEVVKVEDEEDSLFEMVKEILKTVVYAITDIETFQPKPRRITCVSRVYRLLAVKSTTPSELFSRKIESGQYSEALKLADTFKLDSDLVYQQQWRKNAVSTDTIEKYLSKVSKKIWAVHQCVDRLPETLPAAKELLQFGLELTNHHILEEINMERSELITSHEDIAVEDLNAYTCELLRCRHVMLFYKERLSLYELILKQEKSTYDKDEYHRLRCNSILHSAMEIAMEGRIFALHCLWPHVKTTTVKLAILEKLPETIPPFVYQHLLPTPRPIDKESVGEDIVSCSIEVPPPTPYEHDWCRKTIFRSIWSSNWSEESTPDTETASELSESGDLAIWYSKRAREIEERSSIVTNALSLITLAHYAGGVPGLEKIFFDLITLDTLVYEINKEGVTLKELEQMTVPETCHALMSMSGPETYLDDIKRILMPFLRRYQQLQGTEDAGEIFYEYLEMVSEEDLCPILLLMQNPDEYAIDESTRVLLAYRCVMAHSGTDQLDIASDLLDTILPSGGEEGEPSDAHVRELRAAVHACGTLAARGVRVAPRDLAERRLSAQRARALLLRLARDQAKSETKPTQADWEKLLKDIMELQEKCFHCISIEQCYEIYASALLSSGELASVRLGAGALAARARGGVRAVPRAQSVRLVLQAAREYFNSASALNDPALELAKCCLTLIKDANAEIQEELDLIAALQIISSFHLNILPIQVRLAENKLQLIEDCLKSDPNAFHASHKLIKLATLLRVEGDDEVAREGEVLMLVCAHAGSRQGWAAGVEAASRLAALRYRPAATLIAQVAEYAHTDRETRMELFAAAATHCSGDNIEAMLLSRLQLELEGLKEMGVTLKETHALSERCPSTDDEFADAITTPVVEKKDLVPSRSEKKIPLFNYLLDSFQNKFSVSQSKTQRELAKRSVCVPEFYNSIYPEHAVSDSYYRYDRFAVPKVLDGRTPVGHAVLQWFYIQNWLYVEKGMNIDVKQEIEMESEVIQKCAEELIYTDTSVGVACLLRGAGPNEATKRFVGGASNDIAISCALYSASVYCNYPEMKDNVYLAEPKQLTEKCLSNENIREDQLQLIRQCIDRLSGMSEVDALRALGLNVNGLLFNADPDYRREMILRVARLAGRENLELACSLSAKYREDALEAWLQHAGAAPAQAHLTADSLPAGDRVQTHERILRALYPDISGENHAALIQLFTVLRGLDEKQLIAGLTAADHIKLLKKCKAASSELDYKLIIEQAPAEELTAHLLSIIKAENIGMIAKFLRTLPPAVKLPISVNTLYTKWLIKYFFSVPKSQESSKKWMQQYRQCASYFNKLSKEELLKFVETTCFSIEAVERVPHGTRNLMIMQAVDYCTQEQENEIKYNKTEQSWAQVSQELTRWARFLENFHSPSVQNIIDNTGIPRDEIWPEIESSHGSAQSMRGPASALVGYSLSGAALASLLQCLRVDLQPRHLLHHLALQLHSVADCEVVVEALVKYHSEGIEIPEELVELVLRHATALGLGAPRRLGLLALRGARPPDLAPVATFSLDILRGEFPDLPYASDLTEDELLTEEGRRAAFATFSASAESLQQRKALVDILACWPPQRDNARSLHCEYVHKLLQNTVETSEELIYIKLLMKQPLLNDEEIQYLIAELPGESIMSMLWIVVLNKCVNAKDCILKLADKYSENIKEQDMDDDLARSLLELQLLIPLVPTALYPHLTAHIVRGEGPYSVAWAVDQLQAAGYKSEAGHLFLHAAGVPVQLRGFSETVKFCYNMFLFQHK